MAENDITLGIDIETKDAISSLSSFQAGASKVFAAVAAAAAAAFASKALFSGISSVIDAANEQVDSINRLNQSMVAAGDFSKDASDKMLEFSKSLSGIIGVDDDAINENLALAKSFGATNDQAIELVKAASDLSAAMGIDLNTAVTQLGGTLSGVPGRLTKIAPELKTLTEASLKSGDAIKILGQRFSGSAAAAAETFSGQIRKASLAFDDFKTELGLIITQNPALVKVIKFISDAVESVANTIGKNKDAFTNALTNGIYTAVTGIGLLIEAFKLLAPVIDTTRRLVVRLVEGFVTIVSGAKVLNAIAQDLSNISLFNRTEATNANAAILDFVESINKLNEVASNDLDISFADPAIESVKALLDEIDKVKETGIIPLSIAPKIAAATIGGGSNDPNNFGRPTVENNLKLPELKLPDFGPQQGPDQLPDQKAIDERNAGIASAIIGAFQKGGEEGAKQVVSAAATGIAAALGAGPFASVIGELVTFLTTDGAAQLVRSVADNIDEVIFALAYNMPQVALALVEVFGTPLFYVRLINAFIDGITTGIDQAFKQAGSQMTENIIAPFKAAWPEIKASLVQFFTGVVDEVKGLLSFFIPFVQPLVDVFQNFIDGFAPVKEALDKIASFFGKGESSAKDKAKSGLQNAGEAIVSGLGFGLTGDTGTVQQSPAQFGLTGPSTTDVNTALLSQILAALQLPINVSSKVNIDSRTLADVMLELSRRNARTVAA